MFDHLICRVHENLRNYRCKIKCRIARYVIIMKIDCEYILILLITIYLLFHFVIEVC